MFPLFIRYYCFIVILSCASYKVSAVDHKNRGTKGDVPMFQSGTTGIQFIKTCIGSVQTSNSDYRYFVDRTHGPDPVHNHVNLTQRSAKMRPAFVSRSYQFTFGT
jgi:hypothetical protein